MRFCHVISVMSFLSHLFSRVKETKDIKRRLWGPQKMKRWTWKFRKTSEKVLAFYMCCMSSESFRILEEYTDKFSSVNMKVTSFLSCFIKICKHIHWNTSLFQNTLIASWQRYTLIPLPICCIYELLWSQKDGTRAMGEITHPVRPSDPAARAATQQVEKSLVSSTG